MTTRWYPAACLGAAMAMGLCSLTARAQEAPAPKPKPAAAAAVDPAEAIPELQNQIRLLMAQVKALQASVAQCQQQIARMNHQDDDSPASPHITQTPAVPHTVIVNNTGDDDAPAPSIKTAGDATTRENPYDGDPGVQSIKAALEQYLKDLKALEDKTLTDAQKSKISDDAATKLGKTLARRICITAVVQNVSMVPGNKATLSTLSNTVREMLRQSKLPGVAGSSTANATFHVTLTEDQAALIRKGDEMLVNASCTVSKDVTNGGTTSVQDVVVIGIQGGWHLILGDYTCKTGAVLAKGLKPSGPKSIGKPAKNTPKKPTITNSSNED